MPVQLPNELAEAALRAASKAGYKNLVEELLNLGVKASSMKGVAATIADFYGHTEVAEVLRSAISREAEKLKSYPSIDSPILENNKDATSPPKHDSTRSKSLRVRRPAGDS